jgi:hypothetical protein
MARNTKLRTKLGPGEYRPDTTERIQRVEDLPKSQFLRLSRNYQHRRCPLCGRSAHRNRHFRRRLHDVGDLIAGRPHTILLTYSQHYWPACHKYFNADTTDLVRQVAIMRTERWSWPSGP